MRSRLLFLPVLGSRSQIRSGRGRARSKEGIKGLAGPALASQSFRKKDSPGPSRPCEPDPQGQVR